MSSHTPVPSDGLDVGWRFLDERANHPGLANSNAHERLEVRWDNEAWTARLELAPNRAEVVVRLSPFWRTSQLLLFRDLPEPDLWLGTDGHGRWGEVNGAHRADLDGVSDIVIPGSASTLVPALRRSTAVVGDTWSVPVAVLDTATLGVVGAELSFARQGTDRWTLTSDHDDIPDWEFVTDEFGVPTTVVGRAERTDAAPADGPPINPA